MISEFWIMKYELRTSNSPDQRSNGVLDLGHFASQLLRQLRVSASDPHTFGSWGSLILREGLTPPHRFCSMSLAPFLTPSWDHLWPSWGQLGPFKLLLKPTWPSSCSLQGIYSHNKTSKQPLCKLSEGLLPPESSKEHWFRLGENMFLTS